MGKVPPGGSGSGCYFARGGKVTKTPPGGSFDERLRGAGAHRRRRPGPPFCGGRPPGGWVCSSGGQSQVGLSFLPRPTGAYALETLECPHYTDTAYPGKTVAAGQLPRHSPDHRRTEQVGRHQAVYGRAEMLSNFDGTRALWPEWRRMHGQNLGRRKWRTNRRDTPS